MKLLFCSKSASEYWIAQAGAERARHRISKAMDISLHS